jgi:hypothetical protein
VGAAAIAVEDQAVVAAGDFVVVQRAFAEGQQASSSAATLPSLRRNMTIFWPQIVRLSNAAFTSTS